MQRLSATVVGFCVFALAAPVAASAQATQTFSTSVSEFTAGVRNQGWWSRVTDNFDANDNYGVATFGGNEPINRNFFTFDLSTACRASAGTLDLTRFEQIGPLTYSLFDVSTPARTLNANNGFGGSIFDDLGTGVSYGT